MVTELKTIAISRETYEGLQELGHTGESFNDVVTRLVNAELRRKK